ncbi:hypothetical protein DFH07DRAFT_758747 [Mycena maculata]|uniref:Uncharacterized protein n=1 Tax=Mycena maculata TaxID=230809 RepID=A0AAD7HQM5_9AGAR|nr:hypothetical protein DFH07DRAFT_758747 [Mycena maculata]
MIHPFTDLVKQFFPRVHAFMRAQLDILEEHSAIVAPFPGSAFSTVEFNFGDTPMHTRKDVRDAFHAPRVITILRDFNPLESAILMVPRDNLAMCCPPGSTIVIASSVKDFFFTKVKPGQMRYLFQQSFHSSIQGWIDRGFRSAAAYDAEATAEEKLEVETRSNAWVPFTVKLFSRLHELYA